MVHVVPRILKNVLTVVIGINGGGELLVQTLTRLQSSPDLLGDTHGRKRNLSLSFDEQLLSAIWIGIAN